MAKITDAERAYHQDFNKIAEDPSLTDEERREALDQAVANLIIFGVNIGEVGVVHSVTASSSSDESDD